MLLLVNSHSFFYHPSFDIAGLLREVHADAIDLLSILLKRQRIVLRANLVQCFFDGAIEGVGI